MGDSGGLLVELFTKVLDANTLADNTGAVRNSLSQFLPKVPNYLTTFPKTLVADDKEEEERKRGEGTMMLNALVLSMSSICLLERHVQSFRVLAMAVPSPRLPVELHRRGRARGLHRGAGERGKDRLQTRSGGVCQVGKDLHHAAQR